jgi:dTDP-4-amino-4,6-dideoxygalactose transaminase
MQLAIDGGPKAIPDDFQKKPWPNYSEEDIAAVVKAMRSGQVWGSNAPNIQELEKEWAAYCGAKYCCGTNGGTAALHMAVAAAGVGPGDEVIVPVYSFHSSASCILHHNAIPVFADIDMRTYTLDPKDFEQKITDRTKAVVAVDLFGLPANWDEINRIAKKHGIATIEDACQAHGAAIRGKKAGVLADVAAFSLNGSKNLSGSEGGLLTTDNEAFFARSAKLEMDVRTIDGKRVYPKYSFGWNYRMNELAAALTRNRLKTLDELNAGRRKNCQFLSDRLRKLEGLLVPIEPEGFTHVYHMYRLQLDNLFAERYNMPIKEIRDSIIYALQTEGVSTGLWIQDILPAMDIYQAKEGYGHGCPWTCAYGSKKDYQYQSSDYPNGVQLTRSTFHLDYFYPPNDFELMDKIAKAFEKVWENMDTFFE